MSRKERIILKIIGIFYILLLISYMILLIIQGFKNKAYNDFNSPIIINERFLYEQFSYEIYNSINSPLLLDLKIQDKCEENYRPLNFLLKLNPNYNYKSTVSISHLFNNKFCIPNYKSLKNKYNPNELKYDNLLKHSVNIDNINNYNTSEENNLNNICEDGYKPCGILDTMNNILCFPKKYNCPLNDMIISKNNDSSLIDDGYDEINLNNSFSIYLNTNENIERPIIITNFISFDKPWNHEYQHIIAYKDNKKNKKREQIPFDDYDIFMRKVPLKNFSFISLNDILNWEKNNKYLKSIINEVKPSETYYLFNKNYIGFKNYEELEQFKKLFKEDNYKDNPLFKFSKALRPGLATSIISIILVIVLVFFLFFIAIISPSIYDSDVFIGLIIFFSAILGLIYFFVYISLFSIDKKKFKIDHFQFDAQLETVFNSFYNRNKQPVYFASIILISIGILPHTVLFLIALFFAIYKLVGSIKEECSFCGLC